MEGEETPNVVLGGRFQLVSSFSSLITKRIDDQDYVSFPKTTHWCLSTDTLTPCLFEHPLLFSHRLALFRSDGTAQTSVFKFLGPILAVLKCSATSVYIITTLAIYKLELNKMKRDRGAVNPITMQSGTKKPNVKTNFGTMPLKTKLQQLNLFYRVPRKSVEGICRNIGFGLQR